MPPSRTRRAPYLCHRCGCKALDCQSGDLLVYVPDEEQKGEGR